MEWCPCPQPARVAAFQGQMSSKHRPPSVVDQTLAARSNPGFCQSRHKLLNIATIYCAILHTRRFLLDFVAEGDMSTLDIDRLNMSIILDSKLKQEPQSTIPHILCQRTQDRPLHSRWANENKVLPVIAMELLVRLLHLLPTIATAVTYCSNGFITI